MAKLQRPLHELEVGLCSGPYTFKTRQDNQTKSFKTKNYRKYTKLRQTPLAIIFSFFFFFNIYFLQNIHFFKWLKARLTNSLALSEYCLYVLKKKEKDCYTGPIWMIL